MFKKTLFLVLLLPSLAKGHMIYSNIANPPSGNDSLGNDGSDVSGPLGNSFTTPSLSPPNLFWALNDVKLNLRPDPSWDGTPGTITLSLWSDGFPPTGGELPISQLATIGVLSLSDLQNGGPGTYDFPVAQPFNMLPLTRYWIMADSGGVINGGRLDWSAPDPGQPGEMYTQMFQGSQGNFDADGFQHAYQMEVNADPVTTPEPASVVLFLMGGLGLLYYRKWI